MASPFSLGVEYHFFGGFQHHPVDCCSEANCDVKRLGESLQNLRRVGETYCFKMDWLEPHIIYAFFKYTGYRWLERCVLLDCMRCTTP